MKLLLCGAALVALLAVGCGHQTMFLNPDTDITFYEVVALAPFENLTSEPVAAASLSRLLRSELWARGNWRVVPEGDWTQAERALRQERNLDRTEPLSTDLLRAVGERLGAQGIFMGTVREYKMDRVGQDDFPLVAFSLQFVDVPTGQIVWDISLSERGGPKFPVFGFGESHTLAELAAKLCRKATSGLTR
jgi:hypothetical protein